MSEEPKVDLKILTAKQRQVYLLRQEGLSFKAIGEAMGIGAGTATRHMHEAERRFREKAYYDAQEAWNQEPIIISTTQGQARALLDCLDWLGLQMQTKASLGRWQDWPGKMPYSARILKQFVEQLQIDLCGEVGWNAYDFWKD